MLLALLAAAPLVLLGALMTGSADISLAGVWHALFGGGNGLESEIVRELRAPRAFSAYACGGLLALAGALLQVLLRNPLADPYILGVSGGSSFAALGGMLLGFSFGTINFFALGGALAAIGIVYALSFKPAGWNMFRLLLTGVVLSAGFAALISALLVLSPAAQVHGMLFWLMGDLSHAAQPFVTWGIFLAVLIAAFLLAPSLNVLVLGESKAKSLGVAVLPLQSGVYFIAALASAAVVMEAGTIGFVGLIVPHALRLAGVNDHRWLLPGAAMAGGAFLTVADTLARSAFGPQQLPVGVLTALLGVPTLLLLIRERR